MDTETHEPHSIGNFLRFQQCLRHAVAGLQEGSHAGPNQDCVSIDSRGRSCCGDSVLVAQSAEGFESLKRHILAYT